MKTRIVISLLLASLALAPSALASTRHLEGSFEGDANATISMSVVVRHGEPRKARDITVTDLDYRCNDTGETGERSASLGTVAIFESGRDGFFEFESEAAAGDAFFVAGGLMRRSVRNVKGGVAYFFDGPSGICESSAADVGRYTVR